MVTGSNLLTSMPCDRNLVRTSASNICKVSPSLSSDNIESYTGRKLGGGTTPLFAQDQDRCHGGVESSQFTR